MNGIDLTKIIASVFSPAVDFLKQHGVWDTLVKVYGIVSGTATSLWSWLHSSADIQTVANLAVSFLKFVLNIFLTLFNVLSNIATWILHLFK